MPQIWKGESPFSVNCLKRTDSIQCVLRQRSTFCLEVEVSAALRNSQRWERSGRQANSEA
jgi:hypothetical protein